MWLTDTSKESISQQSDEQRIEGEIRNQTFCEKVPFLSFLLIIRKFFLYRVRFSSYFGLHELKGLKESLPSEYKWGKIQYRNKRGIPSLIKVVMDDWKDSSVSTVLPTRTGGLAHVKKYNKKGGITY